MIDVQDIAARSLATFIQTFTGIVIASGLSGTVADLDLLMQGGLAGLVAVLTVAHRASQDFLQSRLDGV